MAQIEAGEVSQRRHVSVTQGREAACGSTRNGKSFRAEGQKGKIGFTFLKNHASCCVKNGWERCKKDVYEPSKFQLK